MTNEIIPFRRENIFLFVQIIAISIIAMLVKGGESFASILNLQRCGPASLFCVLIHVFVSYCYAKYIAIKQYHTDNRKESLGYVFSKEEDKMSSKFFKKALFLGFAAGCSGAVLGIGGAIILVPAWMEMGIDKDIASSSSAPLIFSSAFISIFVATLCGMYDSVWQLLFYFVLSFMASYYVKSKSMLK